MARAGGGEAGLVGLHVRGPVFALFDVGERELPVLLRLVDARKEAFALLFLGQVQEEFDDARAVPVQVALEVADGAVAILPDAVVGDELPGKILFAEDRGMHAHDQHLFVIRAVEDADAAALGKLERRAPQEVVLELGRARLLEAHHVAALRIQAAHHVLDHAVLARGVHALKEEEQGVAVAGVMLVLEFPHLGDVLGE